MNKKGYVQDFLFFGVILFILAFVFIVGGKFSNEITDNYNQSAASTTAKSIMTDNLSRYSTIFDYLFIFIFIIFMLAIFISFFMLDTHPALFFVVVIIFAFILIPLGIMSNAFEDFTSNGSLATTVTEFSLTSYIMTNWVFIVTILGFLGMILLFAKVRVGGFR